MYRRRRFAVGSVALLALLGAYCAIVAAAPLPALKANLEPGIEASSEFVADTALTQAAADAQALPTAVGWLHDEQIWSNDEGTHRIASITKLITVLVGLEAAPVETGTDGRATHSPRQTLHSSTRCSRKTARSPPHPLA